jgi:hypothetical protein
MILKSIDHSFQYVERQPKYSTNFHIFIVQIMDNSLLKYSIYSKLLIKHILVTLLINFNQIIRKSNECNYDMICIQIKTLF